LGNAITEKNLIAANKRTLNKTKIHDLNGVSVEVAINSSINELKNIYPDFEFIERFNTNNYKWE
jgi:hypothetical protein